MKKKKIEFVPRLPMEAVIVLRTKGGPQSSKKGKRGYDRKRAKQECSKTLLAPFLYGNLHGIIKNKNKP